MDSLYVGAGLKFLYFQIPVIWENRVRGVKLVKDLQEKVPGPVEVPVPAMCVGIHAWSGSSVRGPEIGVWRSI
jgi:hypothetical protein